MARGVGTAETVCGMGRAKQRGSFRRDGDHKHRRPAWSKGDLDTGRGNELQFVSDQLPGMAADIDEHPYLVVRLEGPLGPDNALFTWDSGGLDLKTGAHPTLRIVARPGQFEVVTNTPTPENIVTAAAMALAGTDFATRFGTPTPFPRNFATGTPVYFVTRQFTPSNVESRVAVAQVATAIAVTTGTYTPTPENWIEVTATFTPVATRTPSLFPPRLCSRA